MIPEQRRTEHEKIIENFFKTSHTKNALLSYIIYPFTGEIMNNHSNHRECFTIAEILNELGYNVDVINWNNSTFIPSKKYDLVIDNHNNLARLSAYFDKQTKKIFHATNAHWLFQNAVEFSRAEDYFKKKRIPVSPLRILPPGNSAGYCDAISMFGNEFTKGTYGKYGSKVQQVPMSVTTEPEWMSRNYGKARNKFLWLNSHGGLLKGLDIVIDAFESLPQFELYICGNFEKDASFLDSIREQLARCPNMKMEGWVDIGSERFKTLTTECAWFISASFSEGGGGSILNGMAKGLIPIISRSCSITLPDTTGFYIEPNTVESLTALLKSVTQLPADTLQEMSSNAYRFIKENHSLENFKNKYKAFLSGVINKNSDGIVLP